MKYLIFLIATSLFISCKPQKSMAEKDTKGNQQIVSHDLSMYPKATEKLKRHVITLAIKDDETNYKVELYVGKVMEVDCNKSSLAGEFEEEVAFGWGYPFYNFTTNGMIRGTKMACPDNTLHQEFIKSSSQLIRYNSKLPIVVYTPSGYEVRYKIWSRNTSEFKATIK